MFHKLQEYKIPRFFFTYKLWKHVIFIHFQINFFHKFHSFHYRRKFFLHKKTCNWVLLPIYSCFPTGALNIYSAKTIFWGTSQLAGIFPQNKTDIRSEAKVQEKKYCSSYVFNRRTQWTVPQNIYSSEKCFQLAKWSVPLEFSPGWKKKYRPENFLFHFHILKS